MSSCFSRYPICLDTLLESAAILAKLILRIRVRKDRVLRRLSTSLYELNFAAVSSSGEPSFCDPIYTPDTSKHFYSILTTLKYICT